MSSELSAFLGDNGWLGRFEKETANTVSLTAMEGSIFWGSVVRFSSYGFAALASVTDKIAGVLCRPYRFKLPETDLVQYETRTILRSGRVLVLSESEANVGDTVYVRALSGSLGSVVGAVRNTHIPGETIPLNCRFEKKGYAGKSALIYFNAF